MKKFLAVVAFIFPTLLFAQTTLNVSVIAGQYNMKDIKNVLQSHAQKLGAGGTVTHSVHQGLIYELELTSRAQKNVFGAYVDYCEAQGEIKDSKGKSMTMKLGRVSFGFTDYYDIGSGFAAGIKLGLCYSAINDQFAFPGVIPQKYYSIGFLVQPGVTWTSKPAPIMFRALVGYELNSQGKTIYTDNNTRYLVTDPDNEAHINWTGIRVGGAIGFRL